MVIGLTGPTGSGKTLASQFLRKFGFDVINADEVVKNLYASCNELVERIEANFVDVCENGVVNKRKLGEIVFSNSTFLRRLETIVWPYAIKEFKNRLTYVKSSYVVLDAPTLFESGANSFCKFTVAVLSDLDVRLDRVVKRDDVSVEFALLRIKNQPASEFYVNRADGLILNNGSKLFLQRGLVSLISGLERLF